MVGKDITDNPQVQGIATAFEGEVQPKFIDATQGEPKNILEYQQLSCQFNHTWITQYLQQSIQQQKWYDNKGNGGKSKDNSFWVFVVVVTVETEK